SRPQSTFVYVSRWLSSARGYTPVHATINIGVRATKNSARGEHRLTESDHVWVRLAGTSTGAGGLERRAIGGSAAPAQRTGSAQPAWFWGVARSAGEGVRRARRATSAPRRCRIRVE